MPIPGVTVEDVDAYSDVSNGSTISVGSAASGGSRHMPRPPTGDSRRSKSVQGRRSRVAKSPYSSSQLKGPPKQQPLKPPARNMWITAMRNGIGSLSTENSPMKTWAGSRSTKQMKTGTRARHLSDYVPMEDLKSKNHVRSASMSASEPHLSGGGPAYKPQEDYYDEIIELKKIINALKAENNVINTKLRRVEGENVLKDRKMEDLLNQRKQPEDVRRTLTDKKGDTSAIVTSLKQKLHAVERTVKDKEAELSQLKKDIKMTNIEELQIQSETYYQEVQRLQLTVLEMQQAQVHDYPGYNSSPRSSPLPGGSKGKPSILTLQRLAEENDHLKAENRSLKKDLLTAIENSSSGNTKVALKTEYADMNRGQLLAKIHELEEKVEDSDRKQMLPRKGSLREEKEAGVEVRRKSISKLTKVPGRIELRGTTSQKLAQLQEREVELLEEKEKQREVIERLKEDRSHYRSVADDLRLQLKSTQDELDRLKGEKGSVGERRRSSANLTSPRKLSIKEPPPADDNDDDLDLMLNDFQQQRAAKALQRHWRGYQGRKREVQEEEMKKNSAAVTLQKNWRRHRERTNQREEASKEEAIREIQAALRGHAVRNNYIEQLDKDLEITDRDEAVVAIQSAMRGHSARKKHLGQPGDELKSRDTRTRGSSSRALRALDPESDDGLVTRSSIGKRHPEPAITGSRRSSLTDAQEPSKGVVRAPSPSHMEATELEPAKVALGEEFTLKDTTRDKRLAPVPLARDKALVPTALPRGQELASDETRDSSAVAQHETLVPKPLPRSKVQARDKKPACDQTCDQSAFARDQTCDQSALANETDSDDDAVVIGRSARSRIDNQKKEKTPLNSGKTVESNQRTSAVDKKKVEKKKKRCRKKQVVKESAENEIEDGTEENSEAEGSRRVISAPRFSNISEHSEEEATSPTRSKSNQNRFGGPRKESEYKKTEERPKRKAEIVESDDNDDDDEAVVSRPRRSLDTGMSQQRPSLSRSNPGNSPPGTSESEIVSRPGLSRTSRGISPINQTEDQPLSRSNRGISPPGTSEGEIVSRPGLSRSSRGIGPTVESRPGLSRSSREISPTVESRPGLSRASGNLAVNRDVNDSESGREESPQRPGLSRSKRPVSGQRPSLNRSGSRDKEKESPRASGSLRSDSEEDSDEDDVIMTGKKSKNPGGNGRSGGRPSLTRRSPASTLPASSQRDSLANSLDNFFSSTVPSKGSSGKKSPRKTHAQVHDSDDDDDDGDDDDDIVVSSLSKFKSKRKEPAKKDSSDSVAGLWASSDKGSGSTKRKSSIKSSKRNTWSPDFEFEKPSSRPESRLDELF